LRLPDSWTKLALMYGILFEVSQVFFIK